MSNINIDDLAAFVDKMPAFPKSVQRIMQLTSDKDSAAKEIVDVIENDPVMTLKILKVINSAFYGIPHKINSIQQAIIHLGLNTINNLALSTAAIGILNKSNKANFNTQKFLLHSLTTGEISKVLAEKHAVPQSDSSAFFTAGLLHDFGKIVFAEFMPEQFRMALEASTQENISLDEAEHHYIGLDHSLAGKLLATKWNLDKPLINTIGHHHHDN
jgi:putative nucleotidyltransferase with HDIG domain